MRLGLGAASFLSLLFIVEAAVVAGIILGAAGYLQIPAIDPKITTILVLGAGLMAGCGILYKSYSCAAIKLISIVPETISEWNMAADELTRFYQANPRVYAKACPEDMDQLSRIYELFPDSACLLSDRQAFELPGFECLRCGQCCSSIRYITVCYDDAKRWVLQKRLDILDSLDVDRRRTPMLAMYKDSVEEAKAGARTLLAEAGIDNEHAFQALYVTKLLECAVYVGRSGGACTFLRDDNGRAACAIQDTKPRVCGKFPYYIGKYTDSRLIKEDSFCPSLKAIAEKRNKKE